LQLLLSIKYLLPNTNIVQLFGNKYYIRIFVSVSPLLLV